MGAWRSLGGGGGSGTCRVSSYITVGACEALLSGRADKVGGGLARDAGSVGCGGRAQGLLYSTEASSRGVVQYRGLLRGCCTVRDKRKRLQWLGSSQVWNG